jgi:cytochrome c551/c552
MNKLFIPLIGLVGLVSIACNSGTSDTGTSTTTGTTSAAPATTGATAAAGANFASVASIATTNCMPCHAADKHKGGVSLASYADVMKGGDDGPIVKAGDPDNSVLVKAISGGDPATKVPKMPPGKTLSPADIQTIKDWIKAGAKES